MKKLLKQIEVHNRNLECEDERVDVNEVMKLLDEAVDDILESIFNVDGIHYKIDRLYDNGDLFHYENGLEGEIDTSEWCHEVLKRAKERVSEVLSYRVAINSASPN